MQEGHLAGVFSTDADAGLSGLFERIELLQGVVETCIFFVDHIWVSHFEELVGRDAVEPLLLRDFLVAGEIEPDEEFYGAGIGGFLFGFV